MVSTLYGSYGLAGAVSAVYVVAQARVLAAAGAAGRPARAGAGHGPAVAIAAVRAGLARRRRHCSRRPPVAVRRRGGDRRRHRVVRVPGPGALGRVLGADPHRMHTAYSLESALDELVFIVGPVLATLLATGVAPDRRADRPAGRDARRRVLVPVAALHRTATRARRLPAPAAAPCWPGPAWRCCPSSSSRWARSSAPPTSSTVAFADESGSKGAGRHHPGDLRARLADLRAALRHAALEAAPLPAVRQRDGRARGRRLLLLPRAVARRARGRHVRRRVRHRADPDQRQRPRAGPGARASG